MEVIKGKDDENKRGKQELRMEEEEVTGQQIKRRKKRKETKERREKNRKTECKGRNKEM